MKSKYSMELRSYYSVQKGLIQNPWVAQTPPILKKGQSLGPAIGSLLGENLWAF